MTAIIIKGRSGSSGVEGDPTLRSYPSLLDNLSGYWHLDESTGNRFDRSANANHLSPFGGLTLGSKIDGMMFTGSQKLAIASNSFLTTGDENFTVTAWIKLFTKTSYRFFVCKDDIFNLLREWNLVYVSQEGSIVDRLVFNVQTNSGIISCPYSFLNPVINTWYFLAAWHDSQNNTLNLQVNNSSIETVSYTGNKSSASNADFTIGNSSNNLNLYHDGNILNVGFWKRILSVQERTDLFNNGYWLKY